MILETGKQPCLPGTATKGRGTDHFSPRAAFTILEIVLVLALMAVAASVVIANFVSFADRSGQLSAEESLHAAIREARFQAASSRKTESLRFDKESGSLTLASGANFPLSAEFGDNEPGEFRFFLVPSAMGLAGFPDPSETRLETPVLYFAPDRSSSPFVVEIDTGRGTPQRLVFDPFSSLVRSPE